LKKEVDSLFENPLLTFDVDWAPDFMIKYVIDKLENKKIKATWFVTHESPILEKLISNPLFEVGIHPNFNSNSTQGKNQDDILKNLKKLAPNSKSIRTHGLLQSTNILQKFYKFGIQNDVSLLLSKEPCLKPHLSQFSKLLRLPYFWEDDIEMMEGSDWINVKKYFDIKGLRIFCFHPIHIFINSKTMNNYNKLKIKKSMKDLKKENTNTYINKNIGVESFFDSFLEKIGMKKTYTISELAEMYLEKINFNGF